MRRVAKIFKNGRSQAVRLPKEFRFESEEVFIWKEGSRIVLSPKPKSWREFFEEVPLASDDFMNEREDITPQVREDLS